LVSDSRQHDGDGDAPFDWDRRGRRRLSAGRMEYQTAEVDAAHADADAADVAADCAGREGVGVGSNFCRRQMTMHAPAGGHNNPHALLAWTEAFQTHDRCRHPRCSRRKASYPLCVHAKCTCILVLWTTSWFPWLWDMDTSRDTTIGACD